MNELTGAKKDGSSCPVGSGSLGGDGVLETETETETETGMCCGDFGVRCVFGGGEIRIGMEVGGEW
jgi:hypothetical protein